MDNAVKAIIIGASIVIVMTVVGIGFKVMTMGQNLASDSMNQLEAMTGEMAEANVVNMDGKTISGSNVVSFIKQRDDSIRIQVKNKATGSEYITYRNTTGIDTTKVGTIDDLSNIGLAKQYVNPNGKFNVKIERDNNDVIILIKFTQI